MVLIINMEISIMNIIIYTPFPEIGTNHSYDIEEKQYAS